MVSSVWMIVLSCFPRKYFHGMLHLFALDSHIIRCHSEIANRSYCALGLHGLKVFWTRFKGKDADLDWRVPIQYRFGLDLMPLYSYACGWGYGRML